MTRISWERLAAVAGIVFVVFYVVAFSLGIEAGESDREILDYYADSGNRAKEVVAFLLIAGAGLAMLVFATSLRSIVARREADRAILGPLAWTGGIGCGVLVLVGNAVSRGTAFASMDSVFSLDPNVYRQLDDIGFLLFVGGAYAAILLVASVSLAALCYGVLPRWLGYAGLASAVLLVTAILFLGFLVLLVWVLAVSVVLGLGRSRADGPRSRRAESASAKRSTI